MARYDGGNQYSINIVHRRSRPIAQHSPWPNGSAERLIGSIRRDCLDHVVWRAASSFPSEIVSKILQRGAHAPVIAEGRAPIPRAVQTVGQTLAGQYWAGCTTNISEREFPTGTGAAFSPARHASLYRRQHVPDPRQAGPNCCARAAAIVALIARVRVRHELKIVAHLVGAVCGIKPAQASVSISILILVFH